MFSSAHYLAVNFEIKYLLLLGEREGYSGPVLPVLKAELWAMLHSKSIVPHA